MPTRQSPLQLLKDVNIYNLQCAVRRAKRRVRELIGPIGIHGVFGSCLPLADLKLEPRRWEDATVGKYRLLRMC